MKTPPKSPSDKSPSDKSPSDKLRKALDKKPPAKTAAYQAVEPSRSEKVRSPAPASTSALEKAPPSRVAASSGGSEQNGKKPAKTVTAAEAKTVVTLVRPAPVMAGKPVLKIADKPALKKASAPAPVISMKPVLVPAAPSARIVSATSEPGFAGAANTIERSFEAAGQGALAVNRKLLDITVQNVKSSLDFAKRLAGAKTPIEMMQMQMSFWQERMGALASQAEELRALSAELVGRSGGL